MNETDLCFISVFTISLTLDWELRGNLISAVFTVLSQRCLEMCAISQTAQMPKKLNHPTLKVLIVDSMELSTASHDRRLALSTYNPLMEQLLVYVNILFISIHKLTSEDLLLK